jgi:flagellar biosynthesis protein FlhF
VRRALGADAMITATKVLEQERGGGVEITALAADGAAAGLPAQPPPVPAETDTDGLRQELAVMHAMLGWLAPALSASNPTLHALVAHGVTPQNIAKLCRSFDAGASASERQRWEAALKRSVPMAQERFSPGARLAFVGPSGVGKTSAVIKLTLHLSQRKAARVGWVSLDQRRLTGTDMLPVYAGVLGVRLEQASNRAELKIALERLAGHDLILIDTPGLNPRRDTDLAELAKTLRLPGVGATLVLGAAGNSAEMLDYCAGYRASLGVQSLWFTKLDECRYLGPLLNVALGAELPLSYLSFGQNVAEDFAAARPDIFASFICTGVTT